MMNGLGKLDLQWVAGVSVEVKDLGNDQKTIGIRWDFTNSNENLTGFVARSGRNLTRFDEILLDSVKISPDLAKDLARSRNFHWKLLSNSISSSFLGFRGREPKATYWSQFLEEKTRH